MFFNRITRSFIKHFRVESNEELKEGVCRGIEEINQEPVIFRWKNKMDEIKVICYVI